MIKTNKSFSKRLKMTKNGKILKRGSGQNHFNAKESRKTQMTQRRYVPFAIRKKTLSRLVPHI